ncbi:LCP family protein [Embleya sp. AB8]|uniref:LCP family protein n=1 Tax=Embleya sp. AB8 TaxID=3156304 RepID=UPI003C780F76
MSDNERAGKQAEPGRDASPETTPDAPTDPEIPTTPPPAQPKPTADPAAAGPGTPGAAAEPAAADGVVADGDATPSAERVAAADAEPGPDGAGEAEPGEAADAQPSEGGVAAAAEAEPGEAGGTGAGQAGKAEQAAAVEAARGEVESADVVEAAPGEAGQATDAQPSEADIAAEQEEAADASRAVVPEQSGAVPVESGNVAQADAVPAEPLAAAVAAMAAAGPDAAPDRLSRRDRRRRIYKRVLIGVAVGVTLCVVAGSVVVYTLYRKLDGNITTEDLTAKLGPEQERPPVVVHNATNILLIGSDDRSGANKAYGDVGEGTARSDTTILLHLAADRKSSVAVSIPRDLMVDIPSCVRPDGSKARAFRDQFNSSFEVGGAACAIKTIEQMTKVRVDHHITVDFSGFKDMVNAVDGVEVCLSKPLHDTAAKIDLPAGKQKLDGEHALGYVRARKNIDDGSDTQRMTRQQRFLAALVKKVKVGDMLTQPWKLYNLLDAGTRSITADPGLDSLKELMDLSDSVKGIPNDKVAFLTVPRQPYRFNTDRDELVQPKADRLFEAIRLDRVAVGPAAAGKDENGFENNGDVRIEQPATPTAPTSPTSGTGKPKTTPPAAGPDPADSPTPSSTSTGDPTSTDGGTPATKPISAADPSALVTVSGRTAEQDVCAG